MMSELSDFIAPGLEDLEAVTGSVVTWNGADYPITPTSAVRGKDLGAGGFKLRADFSFVVRPGVFPGPGPQLKQKVTYLGDEYRIDTIEKIPGQAYLRFECNDPTQ
jgi:hypothetical protein